MLRWRWICFLTLLISSSVSLAQDWTIWLYHSDDALLVQLNQDGTVLETDTIPRDDDYQHPHQVVFSHDHTLMATLAHSQSSFQQRITLYSIATEKIVAIYELPNDSDIIFNRDDQLILTDDAFSQDDSQLVFVSFIGADGWTIHILDTNTGETTHTLPDIHPQVGLQPYLSSADIPQIVKLQDNILHFYIQNRDGNPSPQGHSYAWFLIPDQVRETIAFPNANYDTLATGEVIYPLPDRRFASDNELLPASRLQHNIVMVYQAGDESRYPSIARPELDLLQTHFIQGGERLLIEAWEDDIRTRWLIYSRDGREVRYLPQAGYDITATNDGFLYLTELNDKTILVHVDTRNFETSGDTVWVDEGNWQIVSVRTSVSEDLLPFAQLDNAETPPPYNTDVALQPTPLPTPIPLVYVGREMQIQVFDDGYINLRDEPTTNGDVQALLESGLYVTIVDGPIESGIYTWWKVQLSGREGWLVEEVEGTQVLIPRLPVEEISETEETE